MRKIEHWLGIRPFKRHSLVLLVAGLVYVLIGLSYITSDPTPSRIHSLALVLRWMDLDHWGAVFIFSGLLSILSSRWPPFSETWGYIVLTGLSGTWSAGYLISIWFLHAPAQGYSGVFSWGLIAFLWWAISGLVNPEDGNLVLLARIAALESEIRALRTWKE